MKIAVIVEGATEKEFLIILQEYLESHLAGRMPKLDPVTCHGPIPKGDGLRKLVQNLLSGKSLSQVARDLGVSIESLRSWVKQSQIDQGERPGLTTEEREELRRLRRENRILLEEREIRRIAETCPRKRGNSSLYYGNDN